MISWFKKKHSAVEMHQSATAAAAAADPVRPGTAQSGARADSEVSHSALSDPQGGGPAETQSSIRSRRDERFEARWTGVPPSEASPLPLPRPPLESGEHEIVTRRDDRRCDPLAAPLSPPSTEVRIRALVESYIDFVWRALRRLGVPEADCDDGCQRVWLVLNRKLDCIEPGKERSYIFSVVVRIASEMRRAGARRAEAPFSALGEVAGTDPASNPEGQLQRRQACEALDAILGVMSLELRATFIMFELEGFSSPEIAQTLGVSRGTVASRLRLARVVFEREVARLEAAAEHRTNIPAAGDAL